MGLRFFFLSLPRESRNPVIFQNGASKNVTMCVGVQESSNVGEQRKERNEKKDVSIYYTCLRVVPLSVEILRRFAVCHRCIFSRRFFISPFGDPEEIRSTFDQPRPKGTFGTP